MTKAVTLIFPHQLFKIHPAIYPQRKVVLAEEYLYFNQFSFHKQKLVLHRASMQFYRSYLQKQNIEVDYIDSNADNNVIDIIQKLAKSGITEIHYVDPVDDWLQRRLEKAARQHGIKTTVYTCPNYLNTASETDPFFDKRKTYFQTDFYNWQRKLRKILLQPDGQPEGGKWSYDDENRKPVKKGTFIPGLLFCNENEFVKEARKYVAKNFGENYGSIEPLSKQNDGFFPTTFDEAEAWLDQFFKERFSHFGIYEDAIVAREHYLFHSVLTPMLNIGLLNPEEVISKAISAAAEYNIPLNSLEGFIRQVIGWREFIRIVYVREGRRQRTKNYWGFTRKIPESFWHGTTGIVPVDSVISKVLKVGYTHHIERLMVMGNFMLLCEFDPDDVYKWFMEMYIDAYDWVMVPNTYGMTQFADGGLMTTKPYISGSNYLMKMSDYPKGEWQEIWDGLFWRFMHVHRDVLSKNMRLGMLIKTFDKMPEEKQNKHLTKAAHFLASLDG